MVLSPIKLWNRFWFRPTTATHLAIARIVLFSWVLDTSFGLQSRGWATFAKVVWVPVSFVQAYDIPLLPGPTLARMDVALGVAAFCASIGFLSRLSMTVCALLMLYLCQLPNDFGKVNHDSNVMVVIICFMALSRAGDKWSVDDVLRRRFNWRRSVPELSGEYTWPIRVAWLAAISVYFAAGVAKMRNTGIEWALSDNLHLLLLRHQYSHGPPTQLGVVLAHHDQVCRVFACMALALELSCPLALFHRYLRALIGTGLFFLQMSIWMMMGVLFISQLRCFVLFWIPWGAMADWLIPRLTSLDLARRFTGHGGALAG